MKITLNKNRFNINPDFFLRRAGYGQIKSFHTGKTSYVRRFTRDHYPRLHLYYEISADRIIFDLHLDQKQTSYKGAEHAHNAEHDGPVVEGEIERLKNLLREMAASGISDRVMDAPKEDWEKALAADLARESKTGNPGNRDLNQEKPIEEKKGFFRRIFG